MDYEITCSVSLLQTYLLTSFVLLAYCRL